MDPYGVLRTAVLFVMFTQLLADATSVSAQTTPHQVPISTLAVCEMAMLLHETPDDATSGADAGLALPEPPGIGIQNAIASVLYVLLVIDAALRAQMHTKHRALFLRLFQRVVLPVMPFASTALVDDSDEIPAGIRASITAVINDVGLGSTDGTGLKLRIGRLKATLTSFLSDEKHRTTLSDISASLDKGVPLLAAVMHEET